MTALLLRTALLLPLVSACTNLLIGKKASGTGSPMIAYTSVSFVFLLRLSPRLSACTSTRWCYFVNRRTLDGSTAASGTTQLAKTLPEQCATFGTRCAG